MASLTSPITLLSAVGATGASRAVQVDAGLPAFLQVSGITSATVLLQGSLDGTNWSTLGTSLTADGMITVANAPKYLRANCTVFVTGTITAKIMY
jgi:hypothetical protein